MFRFPTIFFLFVLNVSTHFYEKMTRLSHLHLLEVLFTQTDATHLYSE